MYGMRRDELQILRHDANWKEDFLAEKGRISQCLGDVRVRIEHIGSTAIETIHAKPILDIAILSNEAGLIPLVRCLVELGYEYRGQYEEETDHYYAVRDEGPIRYCQMHIYTQATRDWESKLRFRDVLRRDLALAKEYNDLKLSLAETITDKKLYAEKKNSWVNTFMPKVLNS
ncbi:MAG TPA: GrpB family protein [Pyrinomonadaceae bacterium]|nr:GrpB family protein [Pyrinomonadaceae bacterium]